MRINFLQKSKSSSDLGDDSLKLQKKIPMSLSKMQEDLGPTKHTRLNKQLPGVRGPSAGPVTSGGSGSCLSSTNDLVVQIIRGCRE